MQKTRNRKAPKTLYKNVEINDEKDKKLSIGILNRLIQILRLNKFKLLFISIVISISLYLVWPTPEFSTHVRHWRDSGYIFNFKDKSVFYQDIITLKQPVQLYPVLLILHGFPTSSYDWRNLIKKLQRRFHRIIIPDMLGFGFSDKPKGYAYSIKEQATIAEDLLVNLNITNVHVLAHDYGDSVAQELLARMNHPGSNTFFNIKSVCLSNGGILPEKHQPLIIQKLMLIPYLNSIISRLSNSYIFMSRLSSVFGPATQPSTADLNEYWSIVRHKDGHLAMPSVLQYLPERQENKKRWVSALVGTTIPLHLIYGPLDPINTPEGFLDSYKRLIPHSSISVLENTGHYPHLEDANAFMTSYREFLERVKREFYEL